MNRPQLLHLVQSLCSQCGGFQTLPGSDPVEIVCCAKVTGCQVKVAGELALNKTYDETSDNYTEDILIGSRAEALLQKVETPAETLGVDDVVIKSTGRVAKVTAPDTTNEVNQ